MDGSEKLSTWAWLAASLAMLACVAAYLGAQPPKALPENAPSDRFSGMRAYSHSPRVAHEPHHMGTAALERVRDYLVTTLHGYGVEAEVRRVRVNDGHAIAVVENVMGRIKGKDNKHPVLLTAHYDSVQWGKGAADDGSGTVVMLEAARALNAMPQLDNDVVFVFTGDEEGGGNGAQVCTDDPWLKDAGVCIAFEGRGTHGPAFMFEPSDENGEVIREMAASGVPAQANALMFEVHRRTPNWTDFGHIKKHVPGYNVAFVGGLPYYHTMNDSPENLSPDTLQHQGEYAVTLARWFGNRPAGPARTPDVVFFNTIGTHLVYYPAAWAWPLAAGAGGAALLALVVAFASRRMTLRGSLGAFVYVVGALLVSVALAGAITWGAYKVFYVYLMYNAAGYQAAALLFGAGIMFEAMRRAAARWTPDDLLFPAFVLWGAVLGALIYLLPIGSFAATWPLMGAAIGLLLACIWRGPSRLVIYVIAALPAIAFAMPGMQALHYMGAALTIAPLTFVLGALFMLLGPVIACALSDMASRLIPFGLALAGVVALGVSLATNGFSAAHPKHTSLSYSVDLAAKKARWLSVLPEDEWTRQFFKGAAEYGPVDDMPPYTDEHIWSAPAPVLALEGPKIDLKSDRVENGKRYLSFRYTSPRKAAQAKVIVEEPAKVLSASSDGEELHGGKRAAWSQRIHLMPRTGEMNFDLVLEASEVPVKIRIEETFFELPDLRAIGAAPMPDWMVPRPNTVAWWEGTHADSNETLVSDTITLPAPAAAKTTI